MEKDDGLILDPTQPDVEQEDLEKHVDDTSETDSEENKETEVEVESKKVKIGDSEYDPDQLTDFLDKAKKYDDLLPEFTRRSQRLSQYEKKIDGEKKEKIVVDENVPIDQETEKVLDNWAKKKGYVSKDEFLKTQYDNEKDFQVKTFIEGHPEYNMDNDPENLKWNRIVNEINSFYRMPENPKDIGKLLGRVHGGLYGDKQKEKDLEGQALAKIQKTKMATLGGAGKESFKNTSVAKVQLTESQKDVYRKGGWSEEEIKELTN